MPKTYFLTPPVYTTKQRKKNINHWVFLSHNRTLLYFPKNVFMLCKCKEENHKALIGFSISSLWSLKTETSLMPKHSSIPDQYNKYGFFLLQSNL